MLNLDIVRRPGTKRPVLKQIIPIEDLRRLKFTLPHLPWKPIIAAAAGAAALAAAGLIYLPSATVTVHAQREPVARDFEILVDKNQESPSSAVLAVGAKLVEREVERSKKFPSTGARNAGRSASGFVSIYNFSKTTLILKAQTTEITVNGRKYHFTQDVGSIRPTARIGLEDEEIDETSLVPPVPIVASGPGEEFNLPPGTRLEIDNEAFGAQPKLLYAVASEAISGGTTKLVKFVTQTDIDSASNLLSQELIADAKAQLALENSEIRILDNAMETQILEQQSEFPVGREVEEFNLHVRIKLRALTYDENDVRNIIFERVRRLLPPDKLLSEGTASLEAQLSSLNLSEGQGILRVHFEGEIVYHLDREELLGKIKGKTTEEIREIFLSRPEINSLEIELFPFWVKTSPKLASRIRLDIR